MASDSAVVATAQLVSQWNITEVPTGTPSCVSDRIVSRDFNPGAEQLSPDSTVPVTKYSGPEYTIAASKVEIDLTDLEGSQGNIDGTGLKVQGLRVQMASTNTDPITIGPGDSDAYELFGVGNELELSPGARVDFFFNETLWDVMGTSGTDPKNIKLTGTDDDVAKVELLLG